MIKFGFSIWSCYGLRCVVRKPAVAMIAGVDGGGKTTYLGKLAYRLKKAGERVRFCLLLLQCDRCLYKERVLGY